MGIACILAVLGIGSIAISIITWKREKEVVFSFDTGVYDRAIDLEIKLNGFSSDAKIYYTMDGNEPKQHGKVYKNKIQSMISSI